MIKKGISRSFEDLIIVPGHALFKDEVEILPRDLYSDKNWVLLPYQKDEINFYLEHIKQGVKLACANKSALLYFSGGYTRQDAKNWSEAETYAAIAKSFCPKNLIKRIRIDDQSHDSFQNLFCSIKNFTEFCGCLPKRIWVVGWKFKEERYQFHCQTIGFPLSKFTYVGVNNPSDLGYEDAEKRTILKFKINPLGISGVNIDKPEGRVWSDSVNSSPRPQVNIFNCNLNFS